MQVDITSVSSKGQIVIPLAIREELGLLAGTKLAVAAEGGKLYLEPLKSPDPAEFERLAKETRKIARQAGVKRSDLPAIIKRVRRARSR